MARYREPYTLFKRGDYWYYRTYDTAGYRTTAKSTGKTSKGAAKAYCDELFLHGSLYDGSGKRFCEYAKGFYDNDSLFVKDRIRPLSAGTIYGYQTILTAHLMPYFGPMKLQDIKLTTLKTFRQKLLEEGQSASYINNIFAGLKNIVRMAIGDGLIVLDPFLQFQQLPTHGVKSARQPFTKEELKQLYDFLMPDFKKNVMLMALTGMRMSECCGITPDDIVRNGDQCFIHLTKQWDYRQKKYIPLKSKSSDAFRDIPIIPELTEYILPYRSKSLQKYVTLFCHNILRKDNLSLHSIRHFFISDTKMKNLNPIKIELVVGHSLKGIEGVYTHFDVNSFPELLQWQKELLEFMKK